jgi:hypothetical protein
MSTVLYDPKGPIVRITLNRPEAMNAFDLPTAQALGRRLQEFDADEKLRVAIVTGAGDKAFCAGADLKGVGDRGTTLAARESFGGLAKILEAGGAERTNVFTRAQLALFGQVPWRVHLPARVGPPTRIVIGDRVGIRAWIRAPPGVCLPTLGTTGDWPRRPNWATARNVRLPPAPTVARLRTAAWLIPLVGPLAAPRSFSNAARVFCHCLASCLVAKGCSRSA